MRWTFSCPGLLCIRVTLIPDPCYNSDTVNEKEDEMAKLLISSQLYENYSINEDGSYNTSPGYWKAKGGSEYVVRDVDLNRVQEIADLASKSIYADNDAFREYVIGWEVVADDFLTEFERDQLAYEGVIRYPAQVIEV